MKDILERVESKLDKLDEKVDKIDMHVVRLDVHVEKNTKDLEDHIQGVKQNRGRIERLEKQESFIKGAAWIIVGLAGVTIAVARLMQYFNK